MVDFSRAEGSKNHRASFIKTSTNVIDFVEGLQSKYNSTWEKLEVVRKEMAAIKEETIQLIKSNKIHLGKQLGRCDNKELNEELLNAINALKDDEKERIQINLIKINNRYDKIQVLGKELEDLAAQLSSYRILEDDYDDEVVISMPKKDSKKSVNTTAPRKETPKPTPVVPSKTEGLEKVVDVHPASETLIIDFESKTSKKEESHDETLDDDIRYFTATDLYDTNELASIQDEVAYINSIDSIQEELQEDKQDEENDDECILFTITDKLTLKEIAKNVYQSESNWKPLYNYGTNTNKIDRKAAEYGVSVEEIASTPGYLADVTLQFPTLLVMPEEVEEENKSHRSRRAA